MQSQAINHQCLDWMPKAVWGPIKWKELHTRALVELPMQGEEEWFAAFVDGLPCPECRAHFEEFLRRTPPDFRSRRNFFRWTVLAHNAVNQALSKPSWTVGAARREHYCPPD
jgi:hypothetical protein